ncbi:unnamed protein product [Medioppia subpectinata]|uniref:Uncharacterized protein n=1 Tax=Medioppia subpectinata TaxID=1979941 RepID=A0A7R9LDP6_9ACAR|nr:unnamed protein product [Medioppia subpectinata]CAG2117421.1 unnamed protein product [Medioppia subpectinata]
MKSSSAKTGPKPITGGFSGHSTKLSLAAQFDDMCRSGNGLILDSQEQNLMNQMLPKWQEMTQELVTTRQQLDKMLAENQELRSSVKLLAADHRRERCRRKRYERQVSEWRNKCLSMKSIAFNNVERNLELEELFAELDLSSSGHQSDYETAYEEDSDDNDDNLTFTVEDSRVDSLMDSCTDDTIDMSLPEYMEYRSSRSLASGSLQK